MPKSVTLDKLDKAESIYPTLQQMREMTATRRMFWTLLAQSGLRVHRACQFAGVSSSSIYRWLTGTQDITTRVLDQLVSMLEVYIKHRDAQLDHQLSCLLEERSRVKESLEITSADPAFSVDQTVQTMELLTRGHEFLACRDPIGRAIETAE